MYKIFCVNQSLNDSREYLLHDYGTEECILISPHVSLQDNEKGSFTFRITNTHPYFSHIEKYKSVIRVISNGVEIFKGTPVEETGDFYNVKEFYCEGELGYLEHSIQRPAEYHDLTVRGFLETMIASHNAQVEEEKQFEVGVVTVVDSNDSLYRYTNYENTLRAIKEKLVKKLGGHLRIRTVNGVRYLDYLADFPRINTQVIEFGKNLLDFSQTIDASDIATAVIPLGAYLETSTIEALDERLTIKNINNNVDYIYSQSAVENYGWITKTVIFDNVHVPSNLYRKGQEYLNDTQFENLVLECTAIDLNILNVDIEQIFLLDKVRVLSAPHGLNRLFPVTKLDIYLDNPEQNTIVLGDAARLSSLTSSDTNRDETIMERINSIPSKRVILDEARANATALITAATHGYVVVTPEELLIMNTNSIDTASSVWRWNLGGLGYSSTGYNGTYTTAITMDGQIVGERIVGHSVSADKLSVEYVTEVENKISGAEANAIADTNQKLTNYWTASTVRTAINNTANSVKISAQETAKAYTDLQLTDYYSKAEIDVQVSDITSEVSQKINSSEWSTRIRQSATDIQFAWNNISRYIQFENAMLKVKDESDRPLIELSHNGMDFYYRNRSIGRIGCFSTLGSNRTGLEFELNGEAQYMVWNVRSSSQIASSPVLLYSRETVYNDGYKAGLNLTCPTYSNSQLYLDDDHNVRKLNSDGVGYGGVFNFGVFNSGNNFTSRISLAPSYFNVWNGVAINFYNALKMHGWVIYDTNLVNSSDCRLKTNIQPTKVKALDIINALELKQFDWIQSGEFEPVGIISQQLREVAPELVEEIDGQLSIKTTKFIYYLLKAIQELSEKSGKGAKNTWKDPYTEKEKREFCEAKREGSVPKLEAKDNSFRSAEHKIPRKKKGESNGRKT